MQTGSAGKLDGQDVAEVRLRSSTGVEVTVLALGARLAGLVAPDRQGRTADIVLGADGIETMLADPGYMGATCGRFANRIAAGRFRLDGRDVQLDRNEGENTLHGGSRGWSHRLWDVEAASDSAATFALTSPDGDMGFPGTVRATCTYRLKGLSLWVEMTATTDAPTVVNMVNHAYFNLAGHGAGDGLAQTLQITARHMLPVDAALLPTGEIATVAGTPFDFTLPRRIDASLPGPGAFDHCLCLTAPVEVLQDRLLRPAAVLEDPVSGRRLRLSTDQPGLQLYTGGHFDGMPGKGGARYGRFAGVALETQGYPDSPNQPHFPQCRLDPGQTYRHLMLLDLTPG